MDNPFDKSAEKRHDWYFSTIRGETVCRRCGKARQLGELFEHCQGWPLNADGRKP